MDFGDEPGRSRALRWRRSLSHRRVRHGGQRGQREHGAQPQQGSVTGRPPSHIRPRVCARSSQAKSEAGTVL